ncbi:lipopolysaccharide biosynthesis protein [Alcanivorax quisquiliarum]|uniref:Membrane protein involved in the export of O-antigen and teichoic acid n=1 Tax=Alcanivorax quisquiliarum TaxID=2933565 RepID=A0ABT0E2R0_9GAMM|nr:hypothetical protein [Alcanivorax quisquiliarum]MCK0536098.1 hypothetical protein [Alcanivorax quisquiliarum]
MSQDSSFWLVAASILSLLLGVASVPFLSRYFSGEELGLYQEFLSYGLIFGPLACLRYETSIVSEEGAGFFYEAYAGAAFVMAVLCGLLILLLPVGFFFELPSWVASFPIFIFSYGLMILASAIALREKKFRSLGIYKVIYFSIYMVAPIGFRIGFDESSYMWLIWFMILGQLCFVFLLPRSRVISIKLATDFIRNNQSFFITLTPLTLLSGLTVQLPVLFMSLHFDYRYLGAYLIASRFLNLPISLVATPAGQYFQSVYLNSGRLHLRKMLLACLMAVFLLYGAILLLSVLDLSRYFGAEWRLIQEIVWFLSIAKILQAINLPLANMLALIKTRRVGLGIVILFLPVRWVLMGLLGPGWEEFLIGTLVGTALFYITYSYFSYRFTIAEVK